MLLVTKLLLFDIPPAQNQEIVADIYITTLVFNFLSFFLSFFLALQPPLGVVFYSPLVGFSLLAYEVS